jgi:hypothetical protein
VFVSSRPVAGKAELATDPLQVGERVVTVGGVEMAAELLRLTAASRIAASDVEVTERP